MNTRLWGWLSIFSDWTTAFLSWFLFYFFRKIVIEEVAFETDRAFILGLIFIPFCWLLLYYLQGSYHEIKRMYRLKSIGLTVSASIIGNAIIFFALILDDDVKDYTSYYLSALLLIGIHFALTILPRLIISSIIVQQLSKKGKGFRALSAGDASFKEKSYQRIQELADQAKTLLVVSHALSTIQDLCTDVIWLHQGRIAKRGLPKDVVKAYTGFLHVGEISAVLEDF
jgi:hypothetical protein